MKFQATNEQIRVLCAKAYNASVPMGMGYLQFSASDLTPNDFISTLTDGDIHFDYLKGRMVKLSIFKVGEDTWEVSDSAPRKDYQSWCSTYPTYRALIESAGCKVIEQ